MASTDALYREIGERIREVRQEAGLTQAKLADCVDLTRTSIANIELGRQKIQVHTLVAIAEALRLKPGSLLQRSDETKADPVDATVPDEFKGEDRQWIKAVLRRKTG